MPEWLLERGIGEDRAALVEDGAIVEALIDRPGGLRPGLVAQARVARILAPRRRALVELDGTEAMLEPLGATPEGARLTVEVTREALGPKRAQVRPAAPGATPRPAPTLEERLAATGHPVTILGSHGPDRLEAAGWSEVLEEARTGRIAFAGGELLVSLTPAMTLIDVDGTLAPAPLARAGARAAGLATRRHGLAGSIGIDLPTVADKAERAAAAAALDEALPPPFERTAVNGWGFVQIVRPRARASLPELLGADPAGAAARALLRRAERDRTVGPRVLAAAPGVIAGIAEGWRVELERRVGATVVLRADPALPISGGHVASA